MAASIAAELRKISSATGKAGGLIVGPTVTKASGEITKSGRELQTYLLLDLQDMLKEQAVGRLGAHPIEEGARIVTGQVAYEKPPRERPDDAWFLVRLSFVSATGANLGDASFRINARNFDPTPSRFFQNSPIFQYSREGRTSMLPGTEAAASKTGNLKHLGRLDRGIAAFEIADYNASEAAFREAAADDDNDLLALSGLYQSALALNKPIEAEQALDRLIDSGIRQGTLSFKFLFRVRSGELRNDFEMSKYYEHWLARTAERLGRTAMCADIEGHSSHSGTAEFNDRLSLRRAQHVAALLGKFNPRLKARIKPVGYGFSRNIVGSGSDDAKDAIDRRVELRIKAC